MSVDPEWKKLYQLVELRLMGVQLRDPLEHPNTTVLLCLKAFRESPRCREMTVSYRTAVRLIVVVFPDGCLLTSYLDQLELEGVISQVVMFFFLFIIWH